MGKRFKTTLRWALLFTALVWGVFLFDWFTGSRLAYWYGLHTREVAGLVGIVTAPFLHGSWGHLLSNTFPLASLLGLLIFFYPRLWPRALVTLWLGTGALVWLLGRHVTHIGASGVVYALAAFLGFSGFFRRDMRAVVISLLVLFYYGSMVVGILPGQEGISWESHLLGLVMGVLAAFLFRGELEDHEIKAQEQKAAKKAQQDLEEEQFLAPDTFNKTKTERNQEAFWEKLKNSRF